MIQEFKHTLPVQSIVLRQDAGEDVTYFEDVAGKIYPLIRIKERVIKFPDIVDFSLNIGSQFLPTASITFDDADYDFRETNFIERGDVITIFLGNPHDNIHEPIKNDYYVTDVMSSTSGSDVTMFCQLHVPKLWDSSNRVFSSDSVDVLRRIAKEMGLGFITNCKISKDSMNWIQYQSNIEFISHVCKQSYMSPDTKLVTFVDQYSNLNVIDVKIAIDSGATMLLETNPFTGEQLSKTTPLIITTNGFLSDDDPIKIVADRWSPITKSGSESLKWSSTLSGKLLSIVDDSLIDVSIKEIHIQLRKSSMWTHFDNENAHTVWSNAKVINFHNEQLLQGVLLNIDLPTFIHPLVLMETVPVEIHNLAKISIHESQDISETTETLNSVPPTEKSNAHILNERMSGDCIIKSMSITYSRRRSSKIDEQRIRQSLQLFLKDK